MDTTQPVPLRELPDFLVSCGRYSANIEEIQALTGLSYQAVIPGLHRLRHQGRSFSPARGLYVVIPPEYRSWGVVPADWFIDDLMRHLGRDYYVALLSAAERHGASHQAPQVFQAMTDQRVLKRDIKRVRLRFYTSAHIPETPTVKMNTHTGVVPVSTKEATLVDLVTHTRVSGGISNVATIVGEIGELQGSALASLAARHGRAVARRVGWLVEHYGQGTDLEPLRLAARLDQGDPPLLVPSGPKRGHTDPTWRVRLNYPVEPDL